MPFSLTYVMERLSPSETFIAREIDELLQRGWALDVCCLLGRHRNIKPLLLPGLQAMERRFSKAAIKQVVSEVAAFSPQFLGKVRRVPLASGLLHRLVRTRPALIHAQFAGTAADAAALVSAATGIPWTCAVHAQDVFTLSTRSLRRRLRGASGIVACSQLAADCVLKAGATPGCVEVIRHGIPLNLYQYHEPRPENVVLAVCRLVPKKGLDTLLRACALLAGQARSLHCVIVGDGPQHASLRGLCRQLEIQNQVSFTGWLAPEQVRKRIMEASVLVLPSRRLANGDRDGVANALLEAMALGTPVVTTTAGAAGEVLTNTINGMLVPPDDPTALMEAMARVLVPSEFSIAMARTARRTIEERFDAGRNIIQIEKFLTRVLSPTPPHSARKHCATDHFTTRPRAADAEDHERDAHGTG